MASNLWSEDQFRCSVCLDLLKDPVAIPCGHSYCIGCIKNCWDQTDHTGVYSCPQCRETFTPRPILRRNTMLAEVVEKLKKTGFNPPPAQSYAGPGDVLCDFCTGRKFKAVKSCLTCLASYCETHIKPHSEVTPLKRHKLINATGNLEQKLCTEHQKVLEVFCRTDQTCICMLCTQDEHKSHDTVSAKKERTEKHKQLGEIQTEIQQRIQEKLKEVEKLKQAVESLKRSACIEIKESEKIFTELIRSIKKIQTDVIELIGANEKAAVNQAEGRMKKLEQEIAELRRRNTALKQLSETEDHIHFLQNFQSLCAPPEAGDLPSISVNTDISFGAVRKALSELKHFIEDFCKRELVQITSTVDVTLDPDTAYPTLILSAKGKKVRWGVTRQNVPDNPKRFNGWSCVLGREGFTSGRRYWQVLVGGNTGWVLGVSRESAPRKGRFSMTPQQGYWTVRMCGGEFTAVTDPETPVSLRLKPQKLGVYLDYEEGQLSFYNVESRSHIYSFTDMEFNPNEKLYPFFWTWDSDTDLVLESPDPDPVSTAN
ncbi:E3 ubiquitin-protein ligase TRIM39-like isoform X1 [Polyodon spathula]|uniref:E3 ubiquitin-protein ligase TRIM39-like isoform X1 n=1 Tax=Polyodon spathula TaxID=7913 RepID=UPI001B7DA64B|nr:E3 ubiquitin-protein ligase TRIM39-like isoform X1 [Polyodon spathula]